MTPKKTLQDIIQELRTFIEISLREEEKTWDEWIAATTKRLTTRCWEKMQCADVNCPAYNNKCGRCWLISGTMCGGEVQGQYAKKIMSCTACKVFQEVVASDPIIELQELLLVLIHCLRTKQQQLHEAKTAAEEEKEKWEAIIAAIGDGISIQDRDFRILYQNQVLVNMGGAHLGENCFQVYEHNDAVCQGCPIDAAFQDGQVHTTVRNVEGRSGKTYVEITASPIKNTSGEVTAGIEVVRDITGRKHAEEALRRSEAKYMALVHNIPGMIYRASCDWSAEIISGSEKLCGYTENELNALPEKWLGVIHPDDRDRVVEEGSGLSRQQKDLIQTYRITCRDGDNRWVEDHKISFFSDDGVFLGIDGIVFDISERKLFEEKLKNYSMEDSLTGLANRRCFNEFIQNEWSRAVREGAVLSVIFVDIDFFKQYNDIYGHQCGDECLKKVGRCLEDCVKRPGDMTARYGGEEFITVLANTDLTGALEVAESMRESVLAMNMPHAGSAVRNKLTISAGVASLVPQKELSPANLIDLADQALYEAKKEGRNRVKG